MADGAYRLGALDVTVADGVARLTGSDTIAGSTATMDHIFRYAVQHSGLPFLDGVLAAVRQTSANPAAALRLTDVGRLAPSFWADLVGLDADLTVDGVMRRGSWITAPVGGAVPVGSTAPHDRH
jgi:N-acetylglucosamine-6-phosphate deacetylase